MKNASKFIFILSLFLCNFSIAGNAISNKNNKWDGLCYQEDMDTHWILELNKVSKKIFKVSYPTIPCAGTWTIEKKSKNRIILKEVITENVKSCVPVNKVILTKIDNNYYSVSYFTVTSNNIYAFGYIEKVK